MVITIIIIAKDGRLLGCCSCSTLWSCWHHSVSTSSSSKALPATVKRRSPCSSSSCSGAFCELLTVWMAIVNLSVASSALSRACQLSRTPVNWTLSKQRMPFRWHSSTLELTIQRNHSATYTRLHTAFAGQLTADDRHRMGPYHERLYDAMSHTLSLTLKTSLIASTATVYPEYPTYTLSTPSPPSQDFHTLPLQSSEKDSIIISYFMLNIHSIKTVSSAVVYLTFDKFTRR